MGVVNVTPDSFSDGGQFLDPAAAIKHGRRLWAAGADIIDVGGESTRPGAARVDTDAEIARIGEVVHALAVDGICVSVDTSRAQVAAHAIQNGASIVNDVSGGKADTAMAQVVAEAECRIVLMHWRAHSAQMQREAHYVDVVSEVCQELTSSVSAMRDAGVAADNIIVDPGLGFAKTGEHNWTLAAHLDAVRALGYPVLFGASRKSYLGRLLAGPDGQPRPAALRDAATLATSLLAFEAGVWGVRVHDVQGTADARAVWLATRQAR